MKKSPDCTLPYIEKNYRFFPYFKNCRGAINGSYVDAYVPDEAVVRYRNRKGGVSQNVLAVGLWAAKGGSEVGLGSVD